MTFLLFLFFFFLFWISNFALSFLLCVFFLPSSVGLTFQPVFQLFLPSFLPFIISPDSSSSSSSPCSQLATLFLFFLFLSSSFPSSYFLYSFLVFLLHSSGEREIMDRERIMTPVMHGSWCCGGMAGIDGAGDRGTTWGCGLVMSSIGAAPSIWGFRFGK
jgi:hypothetical protein